MVPGTWNAPGENDTVAAASGVAHCCRLQTVPTRIKGTHAPDLRAVRTFEEGG